MAVMRQTIEQRSGHLRIAKDTGPFGETQIRRDDQTSLLVELAHQME